MGFGDVKTGKKSTGFGSVGRSSGGVGPSDDLSTTDGLVSLARKSGFGEEAQAIAEPKPKLSLLQRLGKGLGAFNPAEAILTGSEKGFGKGIGKYISGVFQGIGSAITGTDYEGERRTFADVAEKLGVENSIAKFGIGFLGDVLLDPSTYFGGALARGILKGVGKVGTKALSTVGKIAPDVEAGLRLAGEGLQDALGRAFQFGYGASKGAREDVLTFMSREQQAKLGIAASNLNRLGTGALTKEQSEELALRMIAGKRAEFTAREVGKTAEEAGTIARNTALSGAPEQVAKVLKEQLERSKKFGENIGLENPYEVYFPFIRNDKVQTFLKETNGIKVGSEGYRKQFKNLLTNENLEKDPAKAFFTRESQIVHNEMTRGFLSGFVRKYGKPLDAFESSDEAAKAGYQLIKEKGIFGKELGYVNKYDSALIRDGLTPEFQTVNMLAKATGFDAITSLFKRSVTGLFLPFHVRNMVSGHIQNFEALGAAALNPKNIAVGQKIAYIMAKGGKVPKEFKPFVARFSGDTFYQNDFLTALEKGKELKQLAPILSKETFKETARTFGLGQEAAPFKAARAVGQFIEHQQKATAYITALSQGKGVDEALRLAEMAGFDYRALTRFESQILRRIIPFYSFTRKNVELQLKTLGENPQRINQIIRFFDNAAQAAGEEISPEEYEALPDYIKDKFILKTGEDSKGNPKYSSTGFGTPLEAFADSLSDDPIRKLASQMNPVLKVPLERAFGKDFFQNRDLKEVVDAKAYQILPDTVKDFIDFTEIDKKDKKGNPYKEYRADPEKLHILRNLPTSRLFGYLYDIYSDNEPSDKTLTLATGVRPKPIDLDTVKYFRERDKQRELEDFLVQLGILKRFEKAYKPK